VLMIMTSSGSAKSRTTMVIFGILPKILSMDALPYLTCGFLMVFLTKVTPTLGKDNFRINIIFNWIPKEGCGRG
jgi:hypothetical protein